MGMFDTIIFEKPISCPTCGAEIRSDQTKAFECTLENYRIGDCIAHAEESRIIGDELFCSHCRAMTGTRYYLAVYRGILVGIEQERQAAEEILRSFNLEKLLLWYHDLYRTRERTRADLRRAEGFMYNVCEWFERGYDKPVPEEESKRRLLFIWDREILEASDGPLVALRRFLAESESRRKSDGDDDQLSLW